MISRDGHWRVTVISLDGQQRLRVQHDEPSGIPWHGGPNRYGPVKMAGGWFLAEDVRTPAEVERYVPLWELEDE